MTIYPQLSYLAASSAEIGGFFKLSSIDAATSGWMTLPIGLNPIPAPAIHSSKNNDNVLIN